MTDGLERFKTAQDEPQSGYRTALHELLTGQKRSHWIWYVFPQLANLGRSSMAVAYGIRDLDEALAYLRDPLLRERLVAVTSAVAGGIRKTSSLRSLMGSDIDARKLVSSMTLFGELARRLNLVEPCDDYERLAADADSILRAAEMEGIPACAFTRQRLRERARG